MSIRGLGPARSLIGRVLSAVALVALLHFIVQSPVVPAGSAAGHLAWVGVDTLSPGVICHADTGAPTEGDDGAPAHHHSALCLSCVAGHLGGVFMLPTAVAALGSLLVNDAVLLKPGSLVCRAWLRHRGWARAPPRFVS